MRRNSFRSGTHWTDTAARSWCIAALALTPALAGGPACAQELTFDGAVQEALTRRPLLQADQERIGALEARVTQARSGLLPRVDLQASATDGPLGAPNLGPLGIAGLVGTPIKKKTGGSLNLTQTLLDFGRTHNLVRARRAEVSVGQETLQADRQRVALEVRQAYLQALQAQRLGEVNRRIVEQRRLVARQAETLRANGFASRVDVSLAEASISQAELAVVRSGNEVEVAFSALAAAVGRPVPPTTRLADVAAEGAPAPAAARDLEGAVAEALRSRPEVRQVEAQARAADHLVSAAKAGKRPLLTGVGSVGKINPSPIAESSDKPWAVGLAFTLPVFTGRLVESQVEEARRNGAAARASQEELQNQIRQQVTAAVANLRASEESIRVARVQLTQAQDALSLATQRYQTQLGTIVELNQAQVAEAQAQNDVVRAVYDRALAQAVLDFALGRSVAGAAGGTGK